MKKTILFLLFAFLISALPSPAAVPLLRNNFATTNSPSVLSNIVGAIALDAVGEIAGGSGVTTAVTNQWRLDATNAATAISLTTSNALQTQIDAALTAAASTNIAAYQAMLATNALAIVQGLQLINTSNALATSVTAATNEINTALLTQLTITSNGLSGRLVDTNASIRADMASAFNIQALSIASMASSISNSLADRIIATNDALIVTLNSSSNSLRQFTIDTVEGLSGGGVTADTATNIAAAVVASGVFTPKTWTSEIESTNVSSLTLIGGGATLALTSGGANFGGGAGYIGVGANLTALNGSQVTSGTVALARLDTAVASDSELNNASNTLRSDFASSIALSELGLTSYANQLSNQLWLTIQTNSNPNSVTNNNVGDVTVLGAFAARTNYTSYIESTNTSSLILSAGGDTLTLQSDAATYTGSGGFAGVGTSLTALNASQLTTGTLPAARIADGSLTTNKVDATFHTLLSALTGEVSTAQLNAASNVLWLAKIDSTNSTRLLAQLEITARTNVVSLSNVLRQTFATIGSVSNAGTFYNPTFLGTVTASSLNASNVHFTTAGNSNRVAVYNANGVLTNVPAGTSGQLLAANGSGGHYFTNPPTGEVSTAQFNAGSNVLWVATRDATNNLNTTRDTILNAASNSLYAAIGTGGSGGGAVVSNTTASLALSTWYTNTTAYYLWVNSAIQRAANAGANEAYVFWQLDTDTDGDSDFEFPIFLTASAAAESANDSGVHSAFVGPGQAFQYLDADTGSGVSSIGGPSQLVYFGSVASNSGLTNVAETGILVTVATNAHFKGTVLIKDVLTASNAVVVVSPNGTRTASISVNNAGLITFYSSPAGGASLYGNLTPDSANRFIGTTALPWVATVNGTITPQLSAIPASPNFPTSSSGATNIWWGNIGGNPVILKTNATAPASYYRWRMTDETWIAYP